MEYFSFCVFIIFLFYCKSKKLNDKPKMQAFRQLFLLLLFELRQRKWKSLANRLWKTQNCQRACWKNCNWATWAGGDNKSPKKTAAATSKKKKKKKLCINFRRQADKYIIKLWWMSWVATKKQLQEEEEEGEDGEDGEDDIPWRLILCSERWQRQ